MQRQWLTMVVLFLFFLNIYLWVGGHTLNYEWTVAFQRAFTLLT